MPKPPLAERILALAADRDRAAAIYGDLTELAATRSRTWFLAAYLRTLMSLSWRPLAAFLAGVGVTVAVLYVEQPMVVGEVFFAIGHPHLAALFLAVRSGLWFLVPFAAVRYGLRDKAVRLVVAMLVAMSGTFYLGFWFNFDPVPVTCTACGVLVVASLIDATPWRAPLIPLAGVFAVAFATSAALDRVQWIENLDYRDPVCWMLVLIDMVAVSIVFSLLHAWIHRRFRRLQSAGAAHA